LFRTHVSELHRESPMQYRKISEIKFGDLIIGHGCKLTVHSPAPFVGAAEDHR